METAHWRFEPSEAVKLIFRKMDFQDLDLLIDENDDDGLADYLVERQERADLKELIAFIDEVQADATMTDGDYDLLLDRCEAGTAFVAVGAARDLFVRLRRKAQDEIDGKIYRPTRSD